MFFACFLHFLCVFFASGAPEARLFFFFFLHFLCVVFASRALEARRGSGNAKTLGGVACSLHFLCLFLAFSLRYLCVWGARGSFFFVFVFFFFFCIFFVFFLHFLCFFLIFFACSLRLGRSRLGEALGRLEMPKT